LTALVGRPNPRVARALAASVLEIAVMGPRVIQQERAVARWTVHDPATFDTEPGETFEVSYQPNSAWNWRFAPHEAVGPYDGTVTLNGNASSSLGDIFHWQI